MGGGETELSDRPGYRLCAAAVARLTDFSVSIVQKIALADELPTAIRRGPIGHWTFDEGAVLEWINEREEEPCRRAEFVQSRKGVRSGGLCKTKNETLHLTVGGRNGRGLQSSAIRVRLWGEDADDLLPTAWRHVDPSQND